jgi:putative SOS response-associated peptidase YedK
MCGRFTIMIEVDDLKDEFHLEDIPADWKPRYNVAPSQSVAVITAEAQNRLEWMRWGLVPSWAKDISIGSKLINARAETVMEKPSFRQAFNRQRCLILADGFYEWQRPVGGKGAGIPHLFRRADGKPFAFAGLWEIWQPKEGGTPLRTCTIITCAANELVSPVHERMPVMLSGAACWDWLNARTQVESLSLLLPYPAERMTSYPVSRLVNNPAVDTPEVVQRIS